MSRYLGGCRRAGLAYGSNIVDALNWQALEVVERKRDLPFDAPLDGKRRRVASRSGE